MLATADVRSTVDLAAEFAALVGPSHVIGERQRLTRAETATFATTARIPLIVRPGSRAEVQACLRLANRHRVPVYPVSSGKNWGYGSTVPASDGNVLLDLRRMNRILAFDESLAYATIEPGVTQRQLHEFLKARGSRLWLDATGASPDCSIIGNTMERGFGHTPYGDHFAHACGLEVVLPTGECVGTGFARFDRSTAAPVYRWGLGPSIDGLFTQGNFGIVTGMTVWLMPAPEHFQAFFFRCDRDEGLGPVIDAVRELRLAGTLRSASHIGNDYKVLNGLGQYPWDVTEGATPLPPSQMAALRTRYRIGVWNGSGGLYGTRRQVAEARRLLMARLKGLAARVEFLDDRKLALAKRFAGAYRLVTGWDLSAALALVEPVYELMRGVPTERPLASAYWRKRTPPPADMDPDRDGCGLLWCAPVAPLEGSHAQRLSRLSIDTLLAHGFEPMLSLTPVTERALTCVVSIAYDRDVPGEDERALRCYEELRQRLEDAGYHGYRQGIQTPPRVEGGPYDALLGTLKRAVDPQGILAPGRYGIESAAAPPDLCRG